MSVGETLKRATAQLIAATPEGNAEVLAHLMRVGARSLRFYCDHESLLYAPIDVIAALEARAGEPIVTRALAGLSARTLTSVHVASDTNALGVIREVSEAVAAVAQLNLNGRNWSLDDARVAQREVTEAMEALAAIGAALAARLGG